MLLTASKHKKSPRLQWKQGDFAYEANSTASYNNRLLRGLHVV